jgi:hypothetical protein
VDGGGWGREGLEEGMKNDGVRLWKWGGREAGGNWGCFGVAVKVTVAKQSDYSIVSLARCWFSTGWRQ